MTEFEIITRATVTKTLIIEETTEDSAIQIAHELFNTNCEGPNEIYTEEILQSKEIKQNISKE